MGQQQLLLLVLGTVIVGLAVVVGIDAFSENRKKSNADALVNDAVRLASDAQAWKLKPAAFGGGADDSDFTNLTLEDLGYETNGDGDYENLNGTFEFGFDSGNLEITATNTETGNQVVVTVEGPDSDDISTQVSELASN
jgi:hypothetical protein